MRWGEKNKGGTYLETLLRHIQSTKLLMGNRKKASVSKQIGGGKKLSLLRFAGKLFEKGSDLGEGVLRTK